MLGKNAIYLARQIADLGLTNMNEATQLDTLKKNEIIVRSFKYAVDDLSTIMYCFMDNNRRSNLYGYKMKFGAIEEIASTLSACLKNASGIWFGVCGKNFSVIADDLEVMVDILNFEIDNNMTTVDSCDKIYKKRQAEAAC